MSGVPRQSEVRALLEASAKSLGQKIRNAQIAFFGGSFTALKRQDMLSLLQAAQPFLGEGGFRGIRVSTRPDAVDSSVLTLLKQYGVTDIELGAQSMQDAVLLACNRGHTAAQVTQAASRVRAAGFGLGLQMMTGLPLSGPEEDKATARALAALLPDTVRIYPAIVLEHTPFAELWRAGDYRPSTLEQAVGLCAQLLCFFTAQAIPVIRLGLHDADSLRAQYLAGPWHPAFRELCEGQILFDKTLALLKAVAPGPVRLRVARGSASKMAGQCRRNLLALKALGYFAHIQETATVRYLDVEVEPLDPTKTRR